MSEMHTDAEIARRAHGGANVCVSVMVQLGSTGILVLRLACTMLSVARRHQRPVNGAKLNTSTLADLQFGACKINGTTTML